MTDEQTILALSDAAYNADTVLQSPTLELAIELLREAGDTVRADELTHRIADAREMIRAARVAGGFLPAV